MSRVVIFETYRRHVTHGAYLAFLAFLAIIAFGTATFEHPATGWPWLVAILAAAAGCGPIGPEFSSGTLQLILVKPVKRWEYLLSRVAGVVLAVWTAAILGAVCELVGRAIWNPSGGPAAVIGRTLLNVMIDAVLTVSLLALLGSITRAYFNIGIYVVCTIGLGVLGGTLGLIRQSHNALGVFLTAHPEVERGLATIDQNLFPDLPPRLDRAWILMVLSNAAVALVLACLAFRRREVPYGAD